jgi:hypothetical protein
MAYLRKYSESSRPDNRFAVQRTRTVPWIPPAILSFQFSRPPTVTSTLHSKLVSSSPLKQSSSALHSPLCPFLSLSLGTASGVNHAPCTTRSFCFPGSAQRISSSNRSLRSLRPSVKFSESPQECIRFGIWEHAPLAIPCPSKRAQKGHFTYEFQSAYSRWFHWTR